MLLVVLLTLLGLLWAVYRRWVSCYRGWERRGFPFLPATFPFGTDPGLALLTTFQGEALHRMYKKAAPTPYFGIYTFRKPFLVIRDPEIVRLVLDKGFSHFEDRMDFQVSKEEPLGHHLFNLEGQRWSVLRERLAPAFDSDKMLAMFSLFVECAETLEELLQYEADSSPDVKELSSRFCTEVVCSCAFGQEMGGRRSLELRKLGPRLASEDLPTLVRVVLARSFPSLLPLMRLRSVPKDVEKYLLKLIKDTVDQRQMRRVKREDFLDLLLELKEAGGKEATEMTHELMAAQCFMFFVAGFETCISVQSHCLYELAVHPSIQDRLSKEIDATLQKHGGLTFQAVMEMEYLDMVINETMRKYPTVPILFRNCTKPFSMPAGNRVLQGDRLLIPVWSLHHDPDFFPEPDKFDPERFSAGRKDTIKPFSYLPFGEGPRACIGKLFGMLQTKVGLITVLKKYKVSPSEETVRPLQFAGTTVFTNTKGPIKLRIATRNT